MVQNGANNREGEFRTWGCRRNRVHAEHGMTIKKPATLTGPPLRAFTPTVKAGVAATLAPAMPMAYDRVHDPHGLPFA
jgi:hypothetical protein